MNSDIVLDTNIVADFLAVYFENNVNGHGSFEMRYNLTTSFVNKVNDIINEFRNGEMVFSKGLVVASSFAFVEIARQFEKISKKRFSLEQFRAFIESPPDWFLIETLNVEMFLFFKELPERVVDKDAKHLSIEWADAIHVVTMLIRGNEALLFTTDNRIRLIESLKDRLWVV